MIETGLSATIDASGAAAGAQQFNQAADSMGDHMEGSLRRIRAAVFGINASFFNLKNILLGLGTERLIAGLVDTQVRFNQLYFTLEAASGGAEHANYEYNFLLSTVQKLGLNLPVAAQNFAMLEAAARGSALQGDKAREVFYGFSTAITALHLPADRANLILGALTRMISTNVVNARELRLQLGFNLPGALVTAAEAMGVTQQRLNEMLRSGKLFASDLLPKMAVALEKTYGGAAKKAADTTQGLINRFHTAIFELGITTNQGGFGTAFDDALRQVVVFLESDRARRAAQEFGQILSTAMHLVIEALMLIADHGTIVLGILSAYAGLRTGVFFLSLADSIRKAWTELKVFLAMLQAVQAVQTTTALSSVLAPAAAAAAPVTLDSLRAAAGIGAGAAATAAEDTSALVSEAAAAAIAADKIKALGEKNATLAYYRYSSILKAKDHVAAMEQELPLFATLAPSVATAAGQMELFAVEQTAAATAAKGMSAAAAGANLTFASLSGKILPELRGALAGMFAAATTSLKAMWASVVGVAESMIAWVGALPVIGQLALLIAAVVGVLYLLRDTQISFGKDSVQFRDIYTGVWNAVKDAASEAVRLIKSAWDSFFGDDTIIGQWLAVMKGAWDKVKEWGKEALAFITPEWIKQYAIAAKNAREAAEKAATSRTLGPASPQPNGVGAPNEPDANALRAIAKLQEEVKYYTDANAVLTEYAGNLELTKNKTVELNAVREAEEKIISLHIEKNSKEADTIRALYKERDFLNHITHVALENYNKEMELLPRTIADQVAMTQALAGGEVAVNKLVVAQAASNYLAQHGIGLKQQQRAESSKLIQEVEAGKLAENYMRQALALKETLSPAYAYAVAQEHIQQLQKAGVLSSDELKRAYDELDKKFDESVNKQLETSKRWSDGLLLGLREYELASQQTAKNVANAFTTSFGTLEDELTKFLDTGKFRFSNFVDSFRHEFNKVIVQKTLGALVGGVLGTQGTGNPDTSGGIFGKIFGKSDLFKKQRGETPVNPLYVSVTNGSFAQDNTLGPMHIPGQSVDEIWTRNAEKVGEVWGEKIPADVDMSWGREITTIGGKFGSMINGVGGLFKKVLSEINSVGTLGGLLKGIPIPGVTGEKYAYGGIADHPQMAMFGEGPYSKEAFVPIPNGSIPVELRGAGTGRTPNFTGKVIIQNSGSEKTAKQGEWRYSPEAEEFVLHVIMKDKISNGPLRRSG
jgi:tape measure domain-containing protein